MSKNRQVILKDKEPFTKVPNKISRFGPSLTKMERRIYPYAISTYLIFAGSSEKFNPGIRYIAEQLGCSKNIAQDAIEFLVAKNMLKRLPYPGPHGRALYEFVPVPQWNPKASFARKRTVGKEDGIDLIKDSASVTEGHLVSLDTGHNNELSQRKKTMNDINEERSSPSSSFQAKDKNIYSHGPLDSDDWLADYWYEDLIREFESLVTGKQMDHILTQAHRVFSDPSTKSFFKQFYVPALENELTACFKIKTLEGKVPKFDVRMMTSRLDVFLQKRFRAVDPEKPYMQFDGDICQKLRSQAVDLFEKFGRRADYLRKVYDVENCDLTNDLEEISKYAIYLGLELATKLKLRGFCKVLGITESSIEKQTILETWRTSDDVLNKYEFLKRISRLYFELYLDVIEKAKYLVPEWAGRSVDEFMWAYSEDIDHLMKLAQIA